MADTWALIKAERRALGEDLEGLSEAQWDVASLCDGWTVRDVVAHLTATAKTTPFGFVKRLVAARFSFDRMSEDGVAAERGTSAADALARYRAVVGATSHPPGPTDSWLGEALIHGEDIRRPLGITRAAPVAAAVQVADFYKGSNLIVGAKKRIAGVRLRATDAEWAHGDGPEAAGPIVSLVLAMTGRKAALDDLAGDGVAVLAGRS
jgi:uncharacterized protein (TIGR03083 family)